MTSPGLTETQQEDHDNQQSTTQIRDTHEGQGCDDRQADNDTMVDNLFRKGEDQERGQEGDFIAAQNG